MVRTRYLFAAILAGLAGLSPPGAPASVIEQVVVAIDGEPYTLSSLKEYSRSKLSRQFPNGNLDPIGQEDREILEEFITDKLVAAEVKRLDIKVSAEDVEHYIGQIRQRNQMSEQELSDILKREGLSREHYQENIRREIEKNEIIKRQVQNKVNITQQDVERYYRLNQKKYLREEKVRLRHILLPVSESAANGGEKTVMAKALELRQRALNGEDFGALARRYSEGAAAAEGGDIGWVSRGSLLSEIDTLAFERLSLGEISQPLKTRLGVHLVKLEARQEAKPLPLEEVAPKVREELQAKALEERFQKWLKSDLRKRHRVDVKLPGLVFKPEETKEETVNSLVAASSKGKKERSFVSYLNPFSYIITETPLEQTEDGEQVGDRKVVSIFGLPLFTTESDDSDQQPLLETPQKEAEPTKKSGGFFSKLWPF